MHATRRRQACIALLKFPEKARQTNLEIMSDSRSHRALRELFMAHSHVAICKFAIPCNQLHGRPESFAHPHDAATQLCSLWVRLQTDADASYGSESFIDRSLGCATSLGLNMLWPVFSRLLLFGRCVGSCPAPQASRIVSPAIAARKRCADGPTHEAGYPPSTYLALSRSLPLSSFSFPRADGRSPIHFSFLPTATFGSTQRTTV